MTQKRASGDSLDELHKLVAESITSELKEACKRPACTECGNKPGIPPALLAQAIKFLAENGINMPAQSGNRVDTLKDAMPDLDGVERGNVVPMRR